jgi:hypothetical protein
MCETNLLHLGLAFEMEAIVGKRERAETFHNPGMRSSGATGTARARVPPRTTLSKQDMVLS